MRRKYSRRRSRSHRSKPLVVRAGLTRTFGGLATFLAVLFLIAGLYILNDALSNPVQAQAGAMIAGAFSIALATILFFYLLKPTSCLRSVAVHHRSGMRSSEERMAFRDASLMEREADSRRDLVYQRIYVDPSRIPPRAQTGDHAREIAGK